MIPFAVVVAALLLLGGAICGIAALLTVSGWRRAVQELEHKMGALEYRVLQEAKRLESKIKVLEYRIARLEALRPEERITSSEEREVEFTAEAPPHDDALRVTGPSVEDGTPAKERGSFRAGPEARPPSGDATRSPVSPVSSAPGSIDRQWWAELEESVGKRWMTWGGALALFLSAGFFLKYAFDNHWLGPTGRIALGLVTGAGLLAAGDRYIRREMRALGQGLMGGGLAILYVALFSAFSLYGMIQQIPAFGAMVLVTAAGMTLAVLHDAVPLGILAILGGLLTPLMVSTGQDARDSLFAYLTVLNLGVLGVAFFKRWRTLDAVAFAGTWLLLAGWFFTFYRSRALTPTLAWIALFFLVFLIIPFAYQIRWRAASSIATFILALANAVVTFSFSYLILHRKHQFVLGFVALIMAASYVSLTPLVRERVPEDTRSLFGFVGLSVVLLTLAIPLHLKLHGITLAWAIEGPVLLYLGYVFSYRPVRIAGFAVLVLAAVRLMATHWPLHAQPYVLFLNRSFGAAMFVPLAAVAYAAIHHRMRDKGTDIDLYLKTAAWLLGSFVALTVVSGEVWWWLGFRGLDMTADWRYFAYTAVSAIWALGSLGFLCGAMWGRSLPSLYGGIVALAVGFAFCLASYIVHKHQPYILFANVRFLAGFLLVFTVIAYAVAAAGWRHLLFQTSRSLSMLLLAAAALFPLVLLSIEVYSYCWENIPDWRRARWAAYMALSVIWGVYALAALGTGFWLRLKELRIAALVLLAVVAAKVLLLDMAQVQQIYRIVSFVVVGLMMISASYLYHRLEQRLAEASGDSG